MKVLINKNFSWSIDSKLKKVLEFFGDIVKLDFTVERTRFKDIPESSYSYIHAVTGEMKYFNSISESWYDNNISIPAKNRGFDMVVLAIDSSDWTSNVAEGFGTPKDCGIQEIVMRAKKSGSYNYEGVRLNGDNFVWILIHEILHRLYDELKLIDNTHKYFLEGKPEKCLEDFKIKTWKYFKLTEKTGSLGHTVADLDTKLVDMLDELRGICGFPFRITSGYRTVAENAKVGGKPNSAHIKRLAVDIACTDSKKRIKIVGEAYKMGFIGIGIDKSFVHLDIDSSENRRIWLY